MRRLHIHPLLICCVDPSVYDAPARKFERMFAIDIQNCKFKIAVEGSGRDGVPRINCKATGLLGTVC
jgi:hypothetical protein